MRKYITIIFFYCIYFFCICIFNQAYLFAFDNNEYLKTLPKSVLVDNKDNYIRFKMKYEMLFNENKISPESDSFMKDLMLFKKNYNKEGNLLIIGYDKPLIKKGESAKIATQLAREIKDYFSYWVDYWNIKLKLLKIEGVESELNNKEYVDIVITNAEFLNVNKQDLYSKFNSIIGRLRNKEGIILSQNGTNIKVDLSLLFEYNTTELKYTTSFILDAILDILKLSTRENSFGLFITVHKNYTYFKGHKEKEILENISQIANKFVINGEKKEKIFMFANENEDVKEKNIDIIFFNKDMNISALTDFVYGPNNRRENKIVELDPPKLFVYKDANSYENNFYPTGWMGDTNDFSVDFNFKEKALPAGENCIKIEYRATGNKGWVGLQWQYPPNNWGNKRESQNLKGRTKLVFFARGLKGGERIAEVKFGGIQGQYSDSDVAWIGNINLTNEWKKYEISLVDKNLENIIGGFSFILTKYDNRHGCIIYLSNIYFE